MAETTYIALIRGINVGGKNLVKMAELKVALTEAGLEDVQTLLQSGNVVFRGPAESRSKIEARLLAECTARLNSKAEFFVRTLTEWEALIEANPFEKEAKADPSHTMLCLMKDNPDAAEVEKLQALVQGPERVQAGKDCLYLVYPDGIGTSKVGKTPGWNKMVGKGTARNWNTVLKLGTLARESG